MSPSLRPHLFRGDVIQDRPVHLWPSAVLGLIQ